MNRTDCHVSLALIKRAVVQFCELGIVLQHSIKHDEGEDAVASAANLAKVTREFLRAMDVHAEARANFASPAFAADFENKLNAITDDYEKTVVLELAKAGKGAIATNKNNAAWIRRGFSRVMHAIKGFGAHFTFGLRGKSGKVHKLTDLCPNLLPNLLALLNRARDLQNTVGNQLPNQLPCLILTT